MTKIFVFLFSVVVTANLMAQTTESFDTEASTTANGWTGMGNKTSPNNYGWADTDVVLGSETEGAMGGIIARRDAYNYFADTVIGTFDRTKTLGLSGSFRLENDNFDGTFYLGYFDQNNLTGDPHFIGIKVDEPSGSSSDPFRGYARVNGDGGEGSGTINLAQDTTLTFNLLWTGNADGSGTLTGTLAGVDVNVTAGPGTGTFTAFGLLAGGLSDRDDKTGNCYFDNLTYSEVTESFDTEASTTANGWTGIGNTTSPNNYGWADTDVVLGPGTEGAIGGIIARRDGYSYFADTDIGTFDRTKTLELSGSFRLENDNFDGTFYLGYFDQNNLQGDPHFIGIKVDEPSGSSSDPFRGYARVNGDGGEGSGTISLAQDTTLTFYLLWTGNADGSGKLTGTLAGQEVNVTAGAGTGTFTAFGLLAGGLSDRDDKTGNCYFDNLIYSEVTASFDTEASTMASGWTGMGNATSPNNYGWADTDVVLGPGTEGAIGGIIARRDAYSYFADTVIGTLDRTKTLELSGNFRLENDNFDGTFYFGYFDHNNLNGDPHFIGIKVDEPSGSSSDPFRGYARVNGDGGEGSGTINLAQDTTLTFNLLWTGNADGSGTLSGSLAGVDVYVTAGAGTGTFTAFGLLAGGLSDRDDKTGNCYFDNLTYGLTYRKKPAATYTVSYDANGGEGTIADDSKTEDEDLVLSDGSGFSLDGYTFSGWNTAADGSGTSYDGGGTYTENADLALFAQWTAELATYTVSYDANGGQGTIADDIKTEDEDLILSDGNGFSRDGYTFSGWNTAADGSGTGYGAGGTYTENADLTLFAQWTDATSVTQGTLDQISIYPNPTSDRVYFENLPEDSRIVLLDMAGRSLLVSHASKLNTGLSLQPYANGLYLVRVIHRQELVKMIKILKQ